MPTAPMAASLWAIATAAALTVTSTAMPDGGAADVAAEASAAPPPRARDAGATPDAPDAAGDGGVPEVGAPEVRVETPAAIPTVKLTGQVLARGTRDPLAGVSIALDGQSAAETDANGNFSLDVRPGRHVLQIQYPSHAPLSQIVDVHRGTPPLVLRLVPARAPGEYETIVRAPPQEAPGLTLERSEITMTPGSLGDPFRVLESLPGVVPIVWPMPIYAVRGSNPGNTGFFLDGLRVPGLFHFALGPAVVHPYFLEDMEFYPGTYPPQYGRYVGGVVASSTAAPPADRLRGSVDVRLFDAGLMLSAPFNGGQGTAAAAVRYAYPMLVLSQLQDDVRLHYWDYQARVDHSLGPGRFTVLAFSSYDMLATRDDFEDAPTDGEQKLTLMFHRLDLRWRAALGGGRLFAALGGGYDETSAPYDELEFFVRSKSLLPRLSFDRPLGSAVDLAVGVDGELNDYRTAKGDADPTTASAVLDPRQALLVGPHAQLVLRLGERVVLTPGFRLDVYRESGHTEIDPAPRVHARFRAHPRVWLEASVGRATQMPSLPLQLPGFEGFGLEHHGLQRAWQASVGAKTDVGHAFQLDVAAFAQRSRLTDVRDPDFGDALLTTNFLVNREALSRGIELMLRRDPRQRLHGWLTYTLSKSERAFEGGVVGPSDWDQRHVINLVVGHRWQRYTLGGRFHLHTGRLVKVDGTTPVVLERLPPFYQLDLRLDRRFLFDSFRLDLYAEVVNTTLTEQVVALRRRGRQTERDGFSIFLPSLGIRAEF